MRENKNKQNLMIKIMAGVIILLVLFLIFLFVVQPQVAKYNDNKRLEGIEYYVLAVILPQLQENGYVQIPIGNETLTLVPYIPEQQAQPVQQEQVQ